MGPIVDFLNAVIWSNALVYLLLGTGLYFSLRTRFVQVRLIKKMVTLLFGNVASETGVSSFQAFALAVAGRVGTGNIAGVATAIALGGPGAVFWMWVIAFLGASSAYVEAALAQVYKDEVDDQYRGGPSYYIEKGLGIKWFAVAFSVSVVVAMGFFLPGIQSNAIAVSMQNAFSIGPAITGGIIVLLLALIIFGGVKRIGRVAEKVVPIMAIVYILVALAMMIVNITEIPRVFGIIIGSAFGAEQAFAGIIGAAISMGVKRGIYSNEAGQGTGPMAAAAAEVDHPAEQGLVQAFSVYFDTLFVCSATAFMIIVSGMYNVYDGDAIIFEGAPGVEYGPAFTQHAVDTFIPGFGLSFVAVALFFFAFTTLLAYGYYAETGVAYLFKKGKTRHTVITVTRIVFLGSVFAGTLSTVGEVWALGDIGVGLMAWLNVVAILLLSKTGILTLKDYEDQLKAGIKVPTFDPDKLGIKNAETWKAINARKAKQNAKV
ncbi:alanine/glycine:cation symporter family protein [Gudongella sp. DL1XJH-153]|uniref:alanine/glycine:cation symporter family protein n=1 Tax=Gudongella sp. DL1XJH-153 TaxID=3409804 RepID=UPI003BB54DBB